MSPSIAAWGDSLTYGNEDGTGVSYPGVVSSLLGAPVYNGGVGGQNCAEIQADFFAGTGELNDLTLIWAGRNDVPGGTTSTVLACIQTMVAALPVPKRFLVLSVLNSGAEPAGSPNYDAIIKLNGSLAAAFPSNYLDVRSMLVAKYNPALAQDAIDNANDAPPTSLRFDILHLNAAGYTDVAGWVAAWIQSHGGVTGSLAQLASGGLWNTTITLVNTSSMPTEVLLNFFDNNGGSLSLPLVFPQTSSAPVQAASLDETIAAGGELTIQTAGSASQPTQEGWAQFLSNGAIAGSAVLVWPTAAGPQATALQFETRDPAAFVLWFDNTGGNATGMAVANLTNQAVTVPVILLDDAGASLGTSSLSLPAYGHESFMLADPDFGYYPVTAGKRGTMEFDTPPGGQISTMGISAAPGGAITNIPVVAK